MSQISDTCGGGDPGRALVAGTLRGYRTWRLQGRRAARRGGPLPLAAVTRPVAWGPALTARCAPKGDAPGDHRAPAAGCRCGIYGWYDPADSGMIGARVFGVIEASGLVLMGERGFRAERARITAVATRSRRLAAACELAGIQVYRRRRDLVRDHPPEDLRALLGDPGEEPAPRPPGPGTAGPAGWDAIVLAAVLARIGLIAGALVMLPAVPAVVAAIAAHVAVLTLVAARVRH
ncbi:MAG TPA: hypothetical protein VFZ77_00220 [Acidimicrobiales bacterium]